MNLERCEVKGEDILPELLGIHFSISIVCLVLIIYYRTFPNPLSTFNYLDIVRMNHPYSSLGRFKRQELTVHSVKNFVLTSKIFRFVLCLLRVLVIWLTFLGVYIVYVLLKITVLRLVKTDVDFRLPPYLVFLYTPRNLPLPLKYTELTPIPKYPYM